MGRLMHEQECEEVFLIRLNELALQINRDRVQAEETARIIQKYFPDWKPWWKEPQNPDLPASSES